MKLALILLAIMGVIEIAAITLGQGSFAVAWANEDGSYYVQEAQNLALGYGITFDRIAPSNASHWGWFFILAGVFKLMPVTWITDPIMLFRIAGVTYFVLLLAAGYVVALRHPFSAVFLVAYLANRGAWYMETNLVLLTLALAIRWPTWLSGFALVLSRTDMVLFSIFTGRWRLAMGACVGFAVVCGINIMVDGSPVSVSAQIKSVGWNDWQTIVRTTLHLGWYYFPVLEITFLLALWHLFMQPKDDYERMLSASFVASCVVLAIHIAHNSEPEGWYLAPLFLTSLLCTDCVVRYYGPELRNQWRLLGLSGIRGGY